MIMAKFCNFVLVFSACMGLVSPALSMGIVGCTLLKLPLSTWFFCELSYSKQATCIATTIDPICDSLNRDWINLCHFCQFFWASGAPNNLRVQHCGKCKNTKSEFFQASNKENSSSHPPDNAISELNEGVTPYPLTNSEIMTTPGRGDPSTDYYPSFTAGPSYNSGKSTAHPVAQKANRDDLDKGSSRTLENSPSTNDVHFINTSALSTGASTATDVRVRYSSSASEIRSFQISPGPRSSLDGDDISLKKSKVSADPGSLSSIGVSSRDASEISRDTSEINMAPSGLIASERPCDKSPVSATSKFSDFSGSPSSSSEIAVKPSSFNSAPFSVSRFNFSDIGVSYSGTSQYRPDSSSSTVDIYSDGPSKSQLNVASTNPFGVQTSVPNKPLSSVDTSSPSNYIYIPNNKSRVSLDPGSTSDIGISYSGGNKPNISQVASLASTHNVVVAPSFYNTSRFSLSRSNYSDIGVSYSSKSQPAPDRSSPFDFKEDPFKPLETSTDSKSMLQVGVSFKKRSSPSA